MSLCEQHGFRPRIAHEATQWLTILGLVGAGLGVSIAPACVRHIAVPEVSCVPLDSTLVVSSVEFVRRNGEQRPMVDALARIASEAYR